MFRYPTNKVPSEKRPIQFKAVDRNVPMHKIGFCSVLSNFPKKETFDLKTKKKTTVSFAERAKNNRKPHTLAREKKSRKVIRKPLFIRFDHQKITKQLAAAQCIDRSTNKHQNRTAKK